MLLCAFCEQNKFADNLLLGLLKVGIINSDFKVKFSKISEKYEKKTDFLNKQAMDP